MKVLKVLLFIIVIVIVAAVSIYAYYGGFETIVLTEEEMGGETVVYEEMIGDYSKTPVIQDKIYQTLLEEEHIQTTKGFGIYYDNPKQVEKSKLRSEIGCIVEGLDNSAIVRLSEKYNVKTLPKDNYIMAEFPYKGKISVLVGISKVYPQMEKYCTEFKEGEGPITEIYDIPNKKIIYRKLSGQ